MAGVLKHPLMDRARAAVERGECRRETPVTRDVEGTLVEGVVDLAFRENGVWTVADFKTDQELGPDLEIYKRQVAFYSSAVAAATGEEATPLLVRL